jgi:hypothetical protein|tara:strand:- start:132 stop:383 length:252 start_codon:yes stop_codon:yes gene_type:complete
MSYQKPNPSPKVVLKQPSASNYVDGLEIRNGRLINMRPPSMMGIEQAAMYRQQMKKQYKIDCIADGIERAKMRMDGDRDIYEM